MLRHHVHYELTIYIGEQWPGLIRPFYWTRDRWDAARETFWYHKHNNQPHLDNIHPKESALFIEFLMWINEGANGKSEQVDGHTRALFHYDSSDGDYIRAEQFKELQT